LSEAHANMSREIALGLDCQPVHEAQGLWRIARMLCWTSVTRMRTPLQE
jgi:hypothetical protein